MKTRSSESEDALFDQIWTSNEGMFRGFLRSWIKRLNLADDCIDDVLQDFNIDLLKFLRNNPNNELIKDPDRFYPYINTMARHVVVRKLRTSIKFAAVSIDEVTLHSTTGNDQHEAIDSAELVVEALNVMKPRDRELMAMKLQGLTLEQMGREIGLKEHSSPVLPQTVQPRLNIAVERFKSLVRQLAESYR